MQAGAFLAVGFLYLFHAVLRWIITVAKAYSFPYSYSWHCYSHQHQHCTALSCHTAIFSLAVLWVCSQTRCSICSWYSLSGFLEGFFFFLVLFLTESCPMRSWWAEWWWVRADAGRADPGSSWVVAQFAVKSAHFCLVEQWCSVGQVNISWKMGLLLSVSLVCLV